MTRPVERRYVGRFAPSPTGPLHLGSLTTAVASYLHARQNDGEWLLRIDDLDPLRTVPGSADSILRTLESLGLQWDRTVHYQHDRSEAYRAAAQYLRQRSLAFYCVCTRKQLREEGGPGELGLRYLGTCRSLDLSEHDAALRVRTDNHPGVFDDLLQGHIVVDIAAETGDFIIWRRDGIAAYHLAVVCDDESLGVTTIVRGCDLLKATALHLHIAKFLGCEPATYAHVPVLVSPDGEKLSKRHFSRPLEDMGVSAVAWAVMTQLGAEPPQELRRAPPEQIWLWALQEWKIESLRGIRSQPLDPRIRAQIESGHFE